MKRPAPYPITSWQFLLVVALVLSFSFLRDQHIGRVVIHGFGLLVWAATMVFRKHVVAMQLQGIALASLFMDLFFLLVLGQGRSEPAGSISFWAALGILEVLLFLLCVRFYQAVSPKEPWPA